MYLGKVIEEGGLGEIPIIECCHNFRACLLCTPTAAAGPAEEI
jgi:hypothetical protein